MNTASKLKINMEQLGIDRIKAFALDFFICFFIFFITNMVVDHILFVNRFFYNGQHWLLNFINLKPVAFIMLFRDVYSNQSIGKEVYFLKVVNKTNWNTKVLLIFRQITILISFYIDAVAYFFTKERILDKFLNVEVVREEQKSTKSSIANIVRLLVLIFISIAINIVLYVYVKYEFVNVFSYNAEKSEIVAAEIQKDADIVNSVKVFIYSRMHNSKKGYVEINVFTVKSYMKKEKREMLIYDLDRIKKSIVNSIDTTSNNIELRLIKDYKTKLEINNFYINYDENLKPNFKRNWYEFFQ
jgi:hypothetical protein